jgi:3-phenylpropionate/cinnamic acid dioxygenase small subunit
MSADASAVRELTDRTAITAVLYTYARLVDERDFAAVAGVFADDCLAEYGVGEEDTLHSAANVVDWLTRRLGDGTATSHHISNVLITFTGADEAETTSYLQAWHRMPGDPVILARYVDRLVRTPAGWRIAHRRMFAHGLIGFPDGILRPLPRKSEPGRAQA